MRSPKDFFKPKALGAPMPLMAVPFRPSRMIHFFDPSNPKMASKVPDLAGKADVVLGNLEDAIQVDNKVAAREGLVKIARDTDFGDAQLWTRVNSLDSPWILDDLMTLVTEIGDKLDVIMVPKVEGEWDIHYVDQLVAQLELMEASAKSPAIQELEQRLNTEPDNLELAYELAIQFSQDGHSREALTLLYDLLQKDINFNEGLAKKMFLDMLATLGKSHPLAVEFQRKFYTLLH